MENNHKIAEFMGLTWVDKTLVAPHGSESEINYKVYNDGINNEIIHLKYDTSWDALIPVVSKIILYFNDEDIKDELDPRLFKILVEDLDVISKSVVYNDIDSCYTRVLDLILLRNLINKDDE